MPRARPIHARGKTGRRILFWTASSQHLRRMRDGLLTLPSSGPLKAGYTSPSCAIFIRAGLSAGQCNQR